MSQAWSAVTFAPTDDAARQVLADELAARGDPLGEFIALHGRFAERGPALEPAAAERLRTLWRAHGEEFAARFSPPHARLSFSRGLPSRLRTTADDWLSSVGTPIPLEHLDLDGVFGADVKQVLSRPLARQLTGLSLRASRRWRDSELRALVEHLPPGLKHLGLTITHPCPEAGPLVLRALASRLESLAFTNALVDDPDDVVMRVAGAGLGELDLDEDLHALNATGTWLEHLAAVPSRSLVLRRGAGGLRRPASDLQISAWPPAPPDVPASATRPGCRFGRWTVTRALGSRPGLDLAVVTAGAEPALLLRATAFTPDLDAPWFDQLPPLPGDGRALRTIDAGDAPSGEWRVLALAACLPLKPSLTGTVHLAPDEWLGALAPAIEASSRSASPADGGSWFRLLLTARGVVTMPGSSELRPPFHRFTFRLGDWLHFSPEGVRAHPPTAASATYSWASVIAHFLGARYPGNPSEVLAMLEAISTKTLDLGPLPGLDPSVRAVLQRCLSRSPGHRPPLGELAEVLARFPVPARLATVLPAVDGERTLHALAALWLDWPLASDPEPVT